MAAVENQTARCFDPRRDIDGISDEALRRRGLRQKSIELYRMLGGMCDTGQARLYYHLQRELVADLRRLVGDAPGFGQSDVTKKLQTLAARGFVRVTGGGVHADYYCVELLPPDSVAEEAPRYRRPAVVTPTCDQQAQLFGGGVTLLLYEPETTEKQHSDSVSKQHSDSVSTEKRNSDSVSRTIYPRARAVEDEDEDEDEDDSGENLDFDSPDSTSADVSAEQPIDATDEQLDLAIAELTTIVAKFHRHHIRLPRPTAEEAEDDRPHERNFSMVVRAHIAVQLGWLTQDWFAGGVDAVVVERGKQRIKNCFALLWTDWKSRNPRTGKTIARIRLPPDWYSRARAPFRLAKEAAAGPSMIGDE
jgi:hypothetical protein